MALPLAEISDKIPSAGWPWFIAAVTSPFGHALTRRYKPVGLVLLPVAVMWALPFTLDVVTSGAGDPFHAAVIAELGLGYPLNCMAATLFPAAAILLGLLPRNAGRTHLAYPSGHEG